MSCAMNSPALSFSQCQTEYSHLCMLGKHSTTELPSYVLLTFITSDTQLFLLPLLNITPSLNHLHLVLLLVSFLTSHFVFHKPMSCHVKYTRVSYNFDVWYFLRLD